MSKNTKYFILIIVGILLIGYITWNSIYKPKYYTLKLSQNLMNQDVETIRSYIENNADVNFGGSTGTTPLMLASYSGSLSKLKLLINSGADVNIIDKSGRNALFYAAERGYYVIVEELVKHGSDYQLKVIIDGELYTPYSIAMKNNYKITALKLKNLSSSP